MPVVGVMSSQSQGVPGQSCSCKASSSSLIGGSGAGWEGTALLHHGSYIKLGCLQFVFSVTEFASKQPKEVPQTSSGPTSFGASVSCPVPLLSSATVSSPSSQDEADMETELPQGSAP